MRGAATEQEAQKAGQNATARYQKRHVIGLSEPLARDRDADAGDDRLRRRSRAAHAAVARAARHKASASDPVVA
jgi:hypothetical protein